MAQEEFREPVSGPEQIRADVFATPQEITRGLLLLGGNVNRGQCPGAKQDCQLPRIAAIRLNAVARAARNQGWRDDVARNTVLRQGTLQLEAARARFVTAAYAPGVAAQSLDETENRRTIGRQRVERWGPVAREQDGGDGRRRVLIEGNQRSRLHGDRPPLYAALRCGVRAA
jgi:hypothetical protein